MTEQDSRPAVDRGDDEEWTGTPETPAETREPTANSDAEAQVRGDAEERADALRTE